MKIEKRDNCYYLVIPSRKRRENDHWIIFYWGWNFDISFEICGYFDCRPRINLDLIFFSLTFILPFRTKWTDECDSPKWGIAIHNRTVWLHLGGKGNMNGGGRWKTWHIPFLTKDWIRTSILLSDDSWAHETKDDRKEFWRNEWEEQKKKWSYDYTDIHDGEVIPTTITIEEREWRPKWLHWTKLFSTVKRTIDIKFSKEVGNRKGSWKGGTIGCSYELLPNEDPIDCIKRMEKVRKF